MSKYSYENDQFMIESGCCIRDKRTGNYIGSVDKGGVVWAEPDDRIKRAVSAFIGECVMNGVTIIVPQGGEITSGGEAK